MTVADIRKACLANSELAFNKESKELLPIEDNPSQTLDADLGRSC